jgi:aryl-alcohol dehydrogenase-like predicted oxidoreductase
LQVTNDVTQATEETSHAILDAYVAAGGNVIDTADMYQGGESERIIGRWLAKPEVAAIRHKLVIATKARNAMGSSVNEVGLSRSHLIHALDQSLARLQTSYIDLYQMHVWDAGTPLEETLRTLDSFVKSGVSGGGTRGGGERGREEWSGRGAKGDG